MWLVDYLLILLIVVELWFKANLVSTLLQRAAFFRLFKEVVDYKSHPLIQLRARTRNYISQLLFYTGKYLQVGGPIWSMGKLVKWENYYGSRGDNIQTRL